MIKYYAYPYDPNATGFYFTSLEDFERKHKPDEEYEIDFIDGDEEIYEIFKAMRVNQGTLYQWFDFLETWDDLNELGKIAYVWLTSDLGYEPQIAIHAVPDVIIYPGTTLDYARDFVAELEPNDDILQQYIDFEQIGEEFRNDIDPDYDEDLANFIDGLSDRKVGEFAVDEGFFDMRNLKNYIDYQGLAETFESAGDIVAYDDEATGNTYVIANANEF